MMNIKNIDEQKTNKDLDRIYTDIIRGIEVLANDSAYVSSISIIITLTFEQIATGCKALREFIERTSSVTLRDYAISAFCSVIASDFERSGLNGAAEQIVSAVSNNIYLDREEKASERNSKVNELHLYSKKTHIDSE